MGTPELAPNLVREVVTKLFPERSQQEWTYDEGEDFEFEEVDETEVIRAADRISVGKAPGLDGVPPEVTKAYMKIRSGDFARMANTLLEKGEFPVQWKRARLVLLPKPNKPPEDPAGYRPLCLLDTAGKAFETLVTSRLAKELDEKEALTVSQYGFRAGRSTIDAVQEVLRLAKEEISKTRRKRRFTMLILLDVRNAFNSMPWEVVMEALKRAEVSPYLRRIVGNYLQDRRIVTPRGEEFRMSAGVPQRSILGPTLWNVAYDGVLRLEMPEGVQTLAYADDLAILVKARDEKMLVRVANDAMERVARWMDANHLALAPEKTEATLLIGTKRCGELEDLCLRDFRFKPKKQVKYIPRSHTGSGHDLCRAHPGGPREGSKDGCCSAKTHAEDARSCRGQETTTGNSGNLNSPIRRTCTGECPREEEECKQDAECAKRDGNWSLPRL